jgi:nuclease S1
VGEVGRVTSAVALVCCIAVASVETWGPQGHRLVAMVAANHLTPAARQNVRSLLGHQTLADVAVWADAYVADHRETAPWHYVNIPANGSAYVSSRDCPRGDCVVDRIRDNHARLADRSLGQSARAMALRFVVHFVGDLHQPFHAIGVERGGNGIPIAVFGSSTCGRGDPSRSSCNLHGLWDSELIGHRRLRDGAYAAELERRIKTRRLAASGSAAGWAMESNALARAAMLPAGGEAGEAYYRAHIATIDERLALGGLRLAQLLNDALR